MVLSVEVMHVLQPIVVQDMKINEVSRSSLYDTGDNATGHNLTIYIYMGTAEDG